MATALVGTPGMTATKRDGVTAALGAWLIVGLFIDGYMHNTRAEQIESFFTPWHGVLYSGFVAVALWIVLPMRGATGPVRERLAALPSGYVAGAVGALIFAVGGLGDTVWHSLLGIEVDLEALLSPPHLVLFAGAALMLTTPARAAWARPDHAPTLRAFAPALASVTLTTLLVGFFFMYASGLFDFHATAGFGRVFEPGGALAGSPPFLGEILSAHGVVARLFTTVILMVPALLLVGRWRTPAGTFTILFSAFALFMWVLADFSLPVVVAAAVVAGVVADVLVARLRPSGERRTALRVFATAVPAVLWTTSFGLLAVTGDLGWPMTLWGGVIIFAAGIGYVLSLLAAPPAVPEAAAT